MMDGFVNGCAKRERTVIRDKRPWMVEANNQMKIHFFFFSENLNDLVENPSTSKDFHYTMK